MPQVVIHYKEHTYTAAVAKGLSVLIGASMAGMEELGFGECGGNLVCGTCHVRVNNGTFAPMKPDEQMMLDTFPQTFANSRMACQLRVEADCDVTWMGAHG